MMDFKNNLDWGGHFHLAMVVPPQRELPYAQDDLRPILPAGKAVLLALANSLISTGMRLKHMAEPKAGLTYSRTEAR